MVTVASSPSASAASPLERHLGSLLAAVLAEAADDEPEALDTGPVSVAALPADDPWLETLEEQLPARGSLERVAQLHAAVARLQALEADALVGFARTHAPRQDHLVEQPDGSLAVPARARADARVVDEVAPMLAVGRRTAALRLAEADQLRRCLPVTADLLGLGFIDYAVAKAVADETAALTEEVAAEVDAGLAGVLVGAPAGRVRREVRRLVAIADAGAVAARVRTATRARCVTYAPLPDGMATLSATGPAPAVRAWFEDLTSRALAPTRPGAATDPFADLAGRAGDRDHRCLDERRFDALGDALDVAGRCDGSTAHGPRRAGRGAGARVELVVSLETVRGEDDCPAELSGHGPVPAVVARAWSRRAAPGRWSTHPPGPPDDPGRSDAGPPGDSGPPGPDEGGRPGDAATPPVSAVACRVAADGGGPYVVPAALARDVRTALPRCTAPGCSVPANRCDLDHAVPWPLGPTCACNLHPLCRTHHRMKTLRGWSVRRADPSGPLAALVWTSPLGHRYETAPEVRWSDVGSARPGRSRRRPGGAEVTDPTPTAAASGRSFRPAHDDAPPF